MMGNGCGKGANCPAGEVHIGHRRPWEYLMGEPGRPKPLCVREAKAWGKVPEGLWGRREKGLSFISIESYWS